jgi:hypothetical protein
MGSCNRKQLDSANIDRTNDVPGTNCPYAGRDAAAHADLTAATAAIGASARRPDAGPTTARNNTILAAAAAHLHGKCMCKENSRK